MDRRQSLLRRSGLAEGIPKRELELTAAYRLGVDIDIGGGWRSSRKVTGWENPQCPF
jgi:hypothetical protein